MNRRPTTSRIRRGRNRRTTQRTKIPAGLAMVGLRKVLSVVLALTAPCTFRLKTACVSGNGTLQRWKKKPWSRARFRGFFVSDHGKVP